MTWDDLRDLRDHGQRPALPVMVTTDELYARRMLAAGIAAIVHRSGEPMPVELLQGLDVILNLGNCERAGAVKRLMDAKGVKPDRLQTWCRCFRQLSVVAGPCEEAREWLAA